MFSRFARRVTSSSFVTNSSRQFAFQPKSAMRMRLFAATTIAAAGYLASSSIKENNSSFSSFVPSFITNYLETESQTAECAAALPLHGVAGTNQERTFIAVKPDGVNRAIVGEIISRFEQKGFKLVALKLIVPTPALAAGHYDDLKTKPFFGGLVKFFSSGPIVGMVWEGKNSIKTGRVLLGETDPAKSAPGSIRGDYAIDIGRNVCHGSDSPEGAQHEINFWFSDKEVFDWNKNDAPWVYEKPAVV